MYLRFVYCTQRSKSERVPESYLISGLLTDFRCMVCVWPNPVWQRNIPLLSSGYRHNHVHVVVIVIVVWKKQRSSTNQVRLKYMNNHCCHYCCWCWWWWPWSWGPWAAWGWRWGPREAWSRRSARSYIRRMIGRSVRNPEGGERWNIKANASDKVLASVQNRKSLTLFLRWQT